MDISTMSFEQVWSTLNAKCLPPQKIRNWTVLKGNLGDIMTVVGLSGNYVEVDTLGAQTIQMVPKKDFEAVFNVWKAYKANRVTRQEICTMTRFSKYVISILHWLESEN
jgi:hypothetical protein